MNTKITKRAVIAAAGMLVLASGAALGADGDGANVGVSATIANIGSRSVTLAAAAPMVSAFSSGTLTTNLNVTVAEVTRTGTAPWSVQAVLDADLTDGTNTIAKSNLAAAPGSVTQTAGGGTAAAGAGGALDAAKTLFTVSDQATNTTYTGTYAQTTPLTLTVPTGTKTGAYTGNISITLVQ